MAKKLEIILRVEGSYLILDCCPRNNLPVSPVIDLRIAPDYDEEHLSFHEQRKTYTLYVNVAILWSISLEERFIAVTCPGCSSAYTFTHEYLDTEFKKLFS